ncbi:MAG TPA: sigma-70 family RNA polymerase sigma factor [Arachnia sp.]|nr:sigma-70 family RNA polymerase sigma factor [Arachnia sp.]HMT87826.1 sigma-70 family RNA polymerase sigma factor [Arachnia sp.]
MTDLTFPRVFLSPAETLQLIGIVRQGDDEASLDARHRVFLGHLRMIQLHAQRVAELSGVSRDDLFQEGCLALGEAIDKFDPSHGHRFSTYAYVVIARRISFFARTWRRGQEVELAHHDAVPDESASHAFERVEATLGDVLELLPARWSRILSLRYGLDGAPRTLTDCATELGCSVSTAGRWETEALAAARRLMERGPELGATRLHLAFDERLREPV